MKKWFALLMALVMMAACAGAMADDLTVMNGSVPAVSGTDFDYSFPDWNIAELTIHTSGLTVKDWGDEGSPAQGRIVIDSGVTSLTLENVHITDKNDESQVGTVTAKPADEFTLMVKSSSIKGGRHGIYAQSSGKINVSVHDSQITATYNPGYHVGSVHVENSSNAYCDIDVEVVNSTISGPSGGVFAQRKDNQTDGRVYVEIINSTVSADWEYAVWAMNGDGNNSASGCAQVDVKDSLISSAYRAGISARSETTALVNIDGRSSITGRPGVDGLNVTVTLGENVTIESKGISAAVEELQNNEALMIDGVTYPGLGVFAGGSMADARFVGGPYSSLTDVKDLVGSAKFIRTGYYVPDAAGLPQTGDSSRLLLWIGALAIVAMAMIARRKREA